MNSLLKNRGVGAATFSLVILLVLLSPAPTLAQDCGQDCEPCGFDGWEGVRFAGDGPYNMNCHTAVPFCVACPPSAADASGLSVNMIVNDLLGTNDADFPTVAAQYSDRLVVNAARGIIAVRGSDCARDAIHAVLFVTVDVALAASNAGVRSLEEHFVGDRPSIEVPTVRMLAAHTR